MDKVIEQIANIDLYSECKSDCVNFRIELNENGLNCDKPEEATLCPHEVAYILSLKAGSHTLAELIAMDIEASERGYRLAIVNDKAELPKDQYKDFTCCTAYDRCASDMLFAGFRKVIEPIDKNDKKGDNKE